MKGKLMVLMVCLLVLCLAAPALDPSGLSRKETGTNTTRSTYLHGNHSFEGQVLDLGEIILNGSLLAQNCTIRMKDLTVNATHKVEFRNCTVELDGSIICGDNCTLIIDDSYVNITQDNNSISMGDGCKLRVRNGSTITTNGTRIFNYPELYKMYVIIIGPWGSFHIEDSTIECFLGISSYSPLIIDNSVINNSMLGVHIDASTTDPDYLRSSIIDSEFDYVMENMIETKSDLFVSHTKISKPAMWYPMQNGIIGHKNNLSVFYSEFYHCNRAIITSEPESNTITVKGCTFEANGLPIYLSKPTECNLIISENTINRNIGGIWLDRDQFSFDSNSDRLILDNNIITNQSDGGAVIEGADVSIYDNFLFNNSNDFSDGLVYWSPYGVVLKNCNGSVKRNHFENNDLIDLYLQECDGMLVKDNFFTMTKYGINFIDSYNVRSEDNTFIHESKAIQSYEMFGDGGAHSGHGYDNDGMWRGSTSSGDSFSNIGLVCIENKNDNWDISNATIYNCYQAFYMENTVSSISRNNSILDCPYGFVVKANSNVSSIGDTFMNSTSNEYEAYGGSTLKIYNSIFDFNKTLSLEGGTIFSYIDFYVTAQDWDGKGVASGDLIITDLSGTKYELLDADLGQPVPVRMANHIWTNFHAELFPLEFKVYDGTGGSRVEMVSPDIYETVDLTLGYKNLKISKVETSDPDPLIGDMLEITITVQNTGTEDIEGVGVQLYGTSIGSEFIDLAPGEEKDVVFVWKTEAGPTFLMARVDHTFSVDEIDETDNDHSFNISAKGLPLPEINADIFDPLVNETVRFEAENTGASYDIAEYMFDFGDGTSQVWISSENTIHKYSSKGSFSARVRMKDIYGHISGWSSSVTIEVTEIVVEPKPPVPKPTVIDFEIVPPTGNIFTNFTFIPQAEVDIGGFLISYDWSMGDGKTFTLTEPTHKYAQDGFYRITLTCRDSHGQTITLTKTLTVYNIPPEAIIEVSRTEAKTTQFIGFDATRSTDRDDDYSDLTFLWTFGDGKTSTNATEYHRFEHGGKYIVTLKVTDDNGNFTTQTVTVTIVQDKSSVLSKLAFPAWLWLLILLLMIVILSIAALHLYYYKRRKFIRSKMQKKKVIIEKRKKRYRAHLDLADVDLSGVFAPDDEATYDMESLSIWDVDQFGRAAKTEEPRFADEEEEPEWEEEEEDLEDYPEDIEDVEELEADEEELETDEEELEADRPDLGGDFGEEVKGSLQEPIEGVSDKRSRVDPDGFSLKPKEPSTSHSRPNQPTSSHSKPTQPSGQSKPTQPSGQSKPTQPSSHSKPIQPSRPRPLTRSFIPADQSDHWTPDKCRTCNTEIDGPFMRKVVSQRGRSKRVLQPFCSKKCVEKYFEI